MPTLNHILAVCCLSLGRSLSFLERNFLNLKLMLPFDPIYNHIQQKRHRTLRLFLKTWIFVPGVISGFTWQFFWLVPCYYPVLIENPMDRIPVRRKSWVPLDSVTRCHFICPPDPINHVCSLPDKQISKMYFTSCPVQIYKIMFWRFLLSRIWSSAQDYAVLGLMTQPSCVLDFHLTESVRWKWFVLAEYQFWNGISLGPSLEYFTWFIGSGGFGCRSTAIKIGEFEVTLHCDEKLKKKKDHH